MHAALVIEGGALRGMHTDGILDVFLEKQIEFPYVVGVSAGVLGGYSYISKQPRRARDVNLQFMGDRRYFNMLNLLRRRSVFDFDFMFGELSRELVPLDFEAFRKSRQRFFATTTDAATGETAFFEKSECNVFERAAAASASLPIFSPPLEIDGRLYYDGGVSNAVPFEKAFEDGFSKVVLLLTRHKGYRKPPVGDLVRRVYGREFKKYPALLEKLLTVPERYNARMDEIDRLEREGKLLAIRPAAPIDMPRMEKNTRKLQALYDRGVADARKSLPALMEYLGA